MLKSVGHVLLLIVRKN